ncbi:DUF433 domain-containing protein [Nostoc sp. C117]|uniref:DUF433 domain-containing protein n=1 Tax=Nostoc sp. C117 TaxID=3349875 RepID=UPI00370D70E0
MKKILERSFILGLERITFDPSSMAGQACIRGMRIPVSLVINLVAYGKPVEEIWVFGIPSASLRYATPSLLP